MAFEMHDWSQEWFDQFLRNKREDVYRDLSVNAEDASYHDLFIDTEMDWPGDGAGFFFHVGAYPTAVKVPDYKAALTIYDAIHEAEQNQKAVFQIGRQLEEIIKVLRYWVDGHEAK